jgi:putative ABC transport system permease protein
LLASIGIYGAVAYTVEQRTGEIGLRMALGAQTRDVLRLVLSQGMKPVLTGLVIGIVATFALGRLIAAQLYQVSAHNPVLLGGAAVLLTATALKACLFAGTSRRARRSGAGVAFGINRTPLSADRIHTRSDFRFLTSGSVTKLGRC